MLITKNDVGRKVRLRNGKEGVITKYDLGCSYPVCLDLGGGESIWYHLDGTICLGYTRREHDIVAFADEPAKPTADVSVEARAAEGKTLRDEFAMAALSGILAAQNHNMAPNDIIAGAAFVLADAMMAAREGK